MKNKLNFDREEKKIESDIYVIYYLLGVNMQTRGRLSTKSHKYSHCWQEKCIFSVSVPKYECDDKYGVLSLSVDDDDEYQCENDGWSTFFFLDDDITWWF